MSTYAPSAAYLVLNLNGAVGVGIGTRIGAFGICKRDQVPALYPDFDPPNVGDSNGRQLTFSPVDTLFIYGKLFRSDTGTGIGGQTIILRLINDADPFNPTVLTYTAVTGQRLGEFNFTIAPNSLAAGLWTVSLEFNGA